MEINELNRELGNIDIYLLDQLLKGKITKEMKILDAGCGEGRNLSYFINNGYDVFGVDKSPIAIKMLRMMAKNYEPERFNESTVEDMIFPPNVFDYVISSAVLHFATSHQHFSVMVEAMVKVLRPGGTLFIRMTTDIGVPPQINSDNGVYSLHDGTQRYLFSVENLENFLKTHGLKLQESLKSVVVHEQRSMGVLVLQKIKE